MCVCVCVCVCVSVCVCVDDSRNLAKFLFVHCVYLIPHITTKWTELN